jgi:LppP/LprE lipoprotein
MLKNIAIPPSRPLRALATIATIGAIGVSGCGSSSSPRTAASSVPTTTTGTASQPTSSTPSTPTSSAPTTTPTTTTTTAPGATGGAVAPSGTGGSGSATGLSGAEAVVARNGYTVANPSDYRSNQTLRVLVGFRRGSADARVQRAFFFVGDRYLGTDTSDTSASIGVVSQDDTGVTLRYGIYTRGQPLCCPRSTANVRYVLDNGHLFPTGQIPPAAARNGT